MLIYTTEPTNQRTATTATKATTAKLARDSESGFQSVARALWLAASVSQSSFDSQIYTPRRLQLAGSCAFPAQNNAGVGACDPENVWTTVESNKEKECNAKQSATTVTMSEMDIYLLGVVIVSLEHTLLRIANLSFASY